MLESNNQKFNHLKIHTQYSICEGAIKINDIANFCKDKKLLLGHLIIAIVINII